MSKFTARICKWVGLPYADLYNLMTWSTSNVDADNESLLVGSASNERAEPVAYVTAAPVLLVDSYAVSPQASKRDKLETRLIENWRAYLNN